MRIAGSPRRVITRAAGILKTAHTRAVSIPRMMHTRAAGIPRMLHIREVGILRMGITSMADTVKVGEWVLSMVLMMLPCVNIIMMFVWAFSSTEKKSKSNFFKAALIMYGVIGVLMVLLWMAMIISAVL